MTASATCGEPLVGGKVCPGNMTAEYDDDFVIFTCDQCGFQAASAARRVDPQVRRRLRLEQAQLPDRFIDRKFEEDTSNAPALALLRSWLAGYDGTLPSLLPAPALFGQPGRGKSHLLAALCIRLVRECDVNVRFRSARSLLRELQRFEDRATAEEAWQRAVTVDVLALDDLGAEQGTDWRVDQISDLVDERYEAERPILLATNFPPGMWERRLDARTVSRLRSMTSPVELKGPDRRQAQLEDREDRDG